MIAAAATWALAAVLPGPASGEAALKFARAELALSPAGARPPAEARLEFSLVPAEGFEWHDAALVAATARIEPPRGWSARPASLELPHAPGRSRRSAAAELVPAAAPRPDGGQEKPGTDLVVDFRYAVRDGSGAVFVEEARVLLALGERELPSATPVEAAAKAPFAEIGQMPAAEASAAKGAERGSPLLPTLFLSVATALVLGGLLAYLRGARKGR